MVKHAEGYTVAELRNFKLVQSQLQIINGKTIYFGVAPFAFGAAPAKGDIWYEYDINNNFLEQWVWNSVLWLSVETYTMEFSPPTSALTNVANNPSFTAYTIRNIYLLNVLITGVQSTLATATNNWILTLDRISQPNVATNITSVNTFSPTIFAANTITTIVHPINTLIDTVATGIKSLRVTESRVGTPSKYLSYKIQWKKARP